MAWLFLRERMSAKIIACIIFAKIGLVLINLHFEHSPTANTSIWGGLLVFLSLLPEAGYYVLTKMHRNTLHVLLLSAIINAINAIILLFFVGHNVIQQALQFNFTQYLALVAISLGSGLFYVFWIAGSNR
jgi:drug/metabolite transporter (DMT)-like permease